jgi:hypothetical protein
MNCALEEINNKLSQLDDPNKTEEKPTYAQQSYEEKNKKKK